MHIAMEPLGQPLHQTFFRTRQIDPRHADLGESEFPGPRLYARDDVLSNKLMADNHPLIVETQVTQVTCVWRTEADTEAFARRLATCAALRDAFIELQGELGAGKTTLVRHLLRALGITGRVKSPTYAVVEPHETPDGLAIFHFDCYRFSDPQEWDDAGFRDIFAGPGLKLVEWPDNARSRLPRCDIALHIDSLTDETRRVTLQAHSQRGIELLKAVT